MIRARATRFRQSPLSWYVVVVVAAIFAAQFGLGESLHAWLWR